MTLNQRVFPDRRFYQEFLKNSVSSVPMCGFPSARTAAFQELRVLLPDGIAADGNDCAAKTPETMSFRGFLYLS